MPLSTEYLYEVDNITIGTNKPGKIILDIKFVRNSTVVSTVIYVKIVLIGTLKYLNSL